MTITQAECQLVPYGASREQEIVALLNLCLGPKLAGQRTEEYWSWKHERNPFGPSIMLLAESDGRLVGVRAFLRWRLRCGDETLEAAKPVDTVTHPEFQRMGIFTRLTTAACQQARELGIRLLFNTPNRNSLPGYLKLGWNEVGTLPLHFKLLRPLGAAWRAACWRLGGGTQQAEDFFRAPPDPAADTLGDDAAFPSLLIGAASVPRLSTARSLEFYRWRYSQHPNISYFAESIRHDGRLDGVLLYRASVRSGLREIMIDEMLLRESGPALVRELIDRLQARVRADYIVVRGTPEPAMSAALRGAGFHQMPRRGITLAARPLDEALPVNLFDAGHWALSLGDLEGL